MRVIMTAPFRSEDGLTIWETGSTQYPSTDYGRMIVQERRVATDPDGALVGPGQDNYLTTAQVQAVQAAADTDDSAIYGTPAPTRWPMGVQQQALVCEAVEASSAGLVYPQACAVVGITAIALGSGTVTVHDDRAASDAARLRFSRATGAMVAGTYYPMVSADEPAGMLFERGVYVSLPSGGVYVLDVVSDIYMAGLMSAGLLCVPQRVTASGRVKGLVTAKSLKVIAPGSAGSLQLHEDHDAANAKRARSVSTAFGSLAADQIVPLAPRGAVRQYRNLYVTVPTGGIVLLNRMPE